jgi:hypothetical protein
MEFVKGIREKVKGMGFERRTHFTRIRPSLIEGTVLIRVDVKKKEGGNCVVVIYCRFHSWRELSGRT